MIIGRQNIIGITVQVRDNITKKSKSFTVHHISLDKLFAKLLFYAEKLSEFSKIKLVCYKKGDINDKETVNGTRENINTEQPEQA
jgi:hypothetical protein